jgi:carbonic anhydrase
LRHIQDVRDQHRTLLDRLADDDSRWNCLCELNVIEQLRNVVNTTLVSDAWSRGQELTIRGWIYGLSDGRLKDLALSLSDTPSRDVRIHDAMARLEQRWLG